LSMVENEVVARAGEALLSRIESGSLHIPYNLGGTTLEGGMDCHTLAEYLLMISGVPSADCDLSGSNAHWRACSWRGTPEECEKQFGEVPVGAAVFIVKEVSESTPEKYRYDGLKDAEHMGVVLDGCAIHASSTRECVARSKFEGETIPNGGWNMIGLFPWVEYGLDVEGDVGDLEVIEDDGIPIYDTLEAAKAAVPVQVSPYTKYVRIISPDENPVKIREQPKRNAVYKFSAPHGELCLYQGEKNGFYKIRYNGKSRYVMQEYGQIIKVKKG